MANPVNQADVSILNRVKNAVVDSANWLGRKVSVIGSTIADYMMKVVEYVKPFFIAIGQFFSNVGSTMKEWFKENKEVTLVAGAGLVVGAVAFAIYSYCFCDESSCSTNTSSTTTESAPAPSA